MRASVRLLAMAALTWTVVGCQDAVDEPPVPLLRVAPIGPSAGAASTSAATSKVAPTSAAPGSKGPVPWAATANDVWVYADPSAQAKRLGYLAPGSAVTGSSVLVEGAGCKPGFVKLKRGFVCGDALTRDGDHPVARWFGVAPKRDGLPFTYVRSRYPTPMRYARIPSEDEQRTHESDLRKHLRAYRKRVKAGDDASLPAGPAPSSLATHTLPSVEGKTRRGMLALGRASKRSGFALLNAFDANGRTFGLTRDLTLIPIDRTHVVMPSKLRGVDLSEVTLPVAIVKSSRARMHRLRGKRLRRGDRIARYTAHGLTGQRREQSGRTYLETRDGTWVRDAQVAVVERFNKAPVWATRGDKWIDVSILSQSLVAYEGERPVFATLVSTGADGLDTSKGRHATVTGTFLIHTKHLTRTMDSDREGERFDLRDVPFVQYFKNGYALHGAYWHDDFGRPRSHGCVNLSPHDAAWLFGWTSPGVPEGWHGALSERGTLVHIHP